MQRKFNFVSFEFSFVHVSRIFIITSPTYFYLHNKSVLSRRPKEVGLGVRHLESLDTGTMRRENVKRFALIGIVDANLQEGFVYGYLWLRPIWEITIPGNHPHQMQEWSRWYVAWTEWWKTFNIYSHQAIMILITLRPKMLPWWPVVTVWVALSCSEHCEG